MFIIVTFPSLAAFLSLETVMITIETYRSSIEAIFSKVEDKGQFIHDIQTRFFKNFIYFHIFIYKFEFCLI